MRRHPHLYQINALAWLRRQSEKYGRALSLATVPDAEWQALARKGFDLIWLMGVWARSQRARQQALSSTALRHTFSKILPGWAEKDVSGSPYAIYAYTLEPALGEPNELHELKRKLNRLGLALILDFVPNHLALDHPWTRTHPERFLTGSAEQAHKHRSWFFKAGAKSYFAHGRDPHFAPWADTVQVNFYSPDLREALLEELKRIARAADGVRCDMAMLALNRVFAHTWGPLLKGWAPPREELWPRMIRRVKSKRRGFLFLAEVYWGLEWELQEMGFDFTYDKTLYDRLLRAPVSDIRGHLRAEALYQRRSARFIENHDEHRAVQAFGAHRSRAAAVVMATVPGLRFFHDGQLEGRHFHLPVQLAREPKEIPHAETIHLYERLLKAVDAPLFHAGEWHLIEPRAAWAGNESHRHLLAWSWVHGRHLGVVAVNYASHRAQGRLAVPLAEHHEETLTFHDALSGEAYHRKTSELRHAGLFVDLAPWHAHLLILA